MSLRNLNEGAIVRQQGGLGNRIKGIVNAMRSYSDNMIHVEWPHTGNVDLPINHIIANEFAQASIANAKIYSSWRLNIDSLYSLPSSIDYWHDRTESGRDIDFEYLRIPHPTRIILAETFARLIPSKQMKTHADQFLVEHPDLKLGVHVRTWKNPNSDFKRISANIIDQISEALNNTIPVGRVLLCSDNEWVSTAIAEQHPNRIVSLHPLSRNSDTAYVELLLLSRMPALVLTRSSTFSEVAWWMGGAKASVVGLIGKHGNNPHDNDPGIHDDAPGVLDEIVPTKFNFCMLRRLGLCEHLDNNTALANATADYTKHYVPLMRGRVMLDIGANIGLSCMGIAKLGYKVTAFECNAECAAVLRATAAINNVDIDVVEAAVGQTDCSTMLYVPKNRADNSALNSTSANYNVCKESVQSYLVQQISLDSWWRSQTKVVPSEIGLIKMDIQGGEIKAIQGARDLLSACRPFERLLIEFEIEPILLEQQNGSVSELFEIIESCGMAVFTTSDLRRRLTTYTHTGASDLFAAFV
jgi:FkbM family methyltransferase